MVEIVSIIIAVVSLVGSLASAAFTAWISFYIDQVKRRTETKALIHKYQDPLVLAASDLQSRLWGLTQGKLLDYIDSEDKRHLVDVYTSFVFGQYLSWTYILRRQAQFLRFATDKKHDLLNAILEKITNELSLTTPGEDPFMLWRGQQMAMGESMTLVEEHGQLYCMGFADFSNKYNKDPDFKKWFQTIAKDITLLARARASGDVVAFNKLRRVQHYLIDLMSFLDQARLDREPDKKWKLAGTPHACLCSDCLPPAKPSKSAEPRSFSMPRVTKTEKLGEP